MLALPFVFVFFVVRFEAGLIVYWVATNTWTIGQQLSHQALPATPEPIAVGAAAAGGGGSGGGSDGRARPKGA